MFSITSLVSNQEYENIDFTLLLKYHTKKSSKETEFAESIIFEHFGKRFLAND